MPHARIFVMMRVTTMDDELIIAVCAQCRQSLGYALEFKEISDSEVKRRSCEFCNRSTVDKMYKANDLNKMRRKAGKGQGND